MRNKSVSRLSSMPIANSQYTENFTLTCPPRTSYPLIILSHSLTASKTYSKITLKNLQVFLVTMFARTSSRQCVFRELLLLQGGSALFCGIRYIGIKKILIYDIIDSVV